MHKTPAVTCVGLALALFGAPLFVAAYRALTGEFHSDLQAFIRELGLLVLLGLLLWLVRRGERQPLSSIGLATARPGRSLLRGAGLAVAALCLTVALYLLLRRVGIELGKSAPGAFRPGLLVTMLMTARAGILEEVFYRGYAIERLQALTGRVWLAGLVPLVVFALAHYRQGVGGVLAVFVVGALFTVFYIRYRDLIANMIGHFSEDFVLNVVLPLLGG